MKEQCICLLIAFVLVATSASAAVSSSKGHLTLLAVRELDGNSTGATADLFLEIKPGTGRVYLDTFPLTKLDTQISTRFAKDISCDYLDLDCDRYDFFYTITAGSSIVGGPSAGAAMAALTTALLTESSFDDATTITGTINSGGFVGPVGGLKEKITAAAQNRNIKKVLIPIGERFAKEDNQTVDMLEFGGGLGLDVVEVATLNDVMYQFTGKRVKDERKNLTMDKNYLATMRSLAVDLCNRSAMLLENVQLEKSLVDQLSDDHNTTMQALQAAGNLTNRGARAFEQGQYYAAASYCFGANVKYQQVIQRQKHMSKSELVWATSKLAGEIAAAREQLSRQKLKTINDLQAYIVVSERIGEASEQINLAESSNQSQEMYLAFAIERLRSADSWSSFFGQKGKEFELDQDVLRQSCLKKIAEAEESYQYVSLFFPNVLESSQTYINGAYELSRNGEYALCLARASNAKADANAILTAIGVDEQHLDTVIDEKLEIVKQSIIEQAEQNAFPILGYSYWEYATSLKEHDKYSTLLYSEYALEMSNLDMYFRKKGESPAYTGGFSIEPLWLWIFASGLSIGFLSGWLAKMYTRKERLFSEARQKGQKRRKG
jgi:uncharacterized protein